MVHDSVANRAVYGISPWKRVRVPSFVYTLGEPTATASWDRDTTSRSPGSPTSLLYNTRQYGLSPAAGDTPWLSPGGVSSPGAGTNMGCVATVPRVTSFSRSSSLVSDLFSLAAEPDTLWQ
ncbi:hypothetical protein KUCAC02_020971 [Chaenocephalus aceratus]|uniref:Uncharacterized protein n=1 Tax=Chaenocephalus aceratus TaxID=36190 RepID=A0ACB9XE68_CHAAC|nr:hypothetical protein KUCAC02_020971 [Chaenocephalus aceratus]